MTGATTVQPTPGYVGRSWTLDADRLVDVVDPSDGEVVGAVPAMQAGDVERAGAAAAEHARAWAGTPVTDSATMT